MIGDMLAQKVMAVIGVSPNTQKYGWIVYHNLKSRGYRVYAVNPNYSEVGGDPCYASVGDLPETPDVVVTVVPPAVTRQTVQQALGIGVKRFWMQPGSEDAEAIAAAEAAGAEVVHHECVMMH